VLGSYQSGQALNALTGDWSGATSYAYQWQRCTSYSGVVLADNPAGYWRLGEAYGATSAADASSDGTANTGTYSNAPTLGIQGTLPGDSDFAAGFDGAGSYLSVPDAANLKPAGAFTLEAWLKMSAANGVVLDKPYVAGTSVSYSLSVASGKAKLTIKTSSAIYSATSTSSVNTGAWKYVVGSFDGSNLRIYVNGSLEATTATAGSLQYSTLALQIARYDQTGANYLNGSLDELALYSSALTATQISAHYTAGTDATGANPCANISGATSSSYTLGSADVGKKLRVSVTATNADGSTSANSASSLVAGNPPANLGQPTLAGGAFAGNTLTAGTGDWSGALPLSYAYQWQRCSPYVSVVGQDGLAGYWRLGEASGTSAVDSAGTNGGTYVGSPTLGRAGALGVDPNTAVGLSGSGQYVQLANTLAISTADFTLEAWFKTTGSASEQRIWDDGGGNYVHIGVLANGKVEAKARNGGGSLTLDSSASYNDGAWHQVALVRSGTSFTLYLDGAQALAPGTLSGSVDSSSSTPTIGAGSAGATPFAGDLDEAAFYSSALSASRIQAHYNARSAPCTDISGATGSTYLLASGDVGTSIGLKLTASNAAGSASANSAALPIAAARVPVNTSPPSLSGSPFVGQTLTVSPGTWDPSASYSYQWQRCSAYGDAVKANSPLSYWRLGDRFGLSATDSAGANIGTYANGPVLGFAGALTDDSDSAVYFDGASQDVQLSQAPNLGSGNFSLEGWFKTTGSASEQRIWDSGGGTTYIHLGVLASGVVEAKVKHSADQAILDSTGTFSDGVWHEFALVRSGTTFTLYIDAAQAATPGTLSGPIDGTSDLPTIAAQSGGGAYFAGALDEIALYKSALTQAQLQAHASLRSTPCADISGATSSSYTLASGDSASSVRAKVTGANTAGSSSAGSVWLKVQPDGTPVNTSAPTLAGAPLVGTGLSGTSGSWSGAPTISYGYQWQRCNGYSQTVLADSPLGYWRLDETAGTTGADSAGSNSASYVGAPSLAVGGANAYDGDTAVALDGSTQYLGLGASVQFNSGDFSIEAWFKSSASTQQQIWDDSSASGGNLTSIKLLGSGSVQVNASDGTGSVLLATSATRPYNDGAWHQVVFTRAGTVFTLYLDAASAATQTTALGDVDIAGTLPRLGRLAVGNNNPFAGALDEVAVYTHALSATQIQNHYKNDRIGCSAIGGATSANYTPTSSDAGYRLALQVSASNGIGSPLPANSAETKVVAYAPPTLATPLDNAGLPRSPPGRTVAKTHSGAAA